MRKISILCLLLAVLLTETFAQWTQPGIEVSMARGFLLPHRQNMKHLPMGPAHVAELRIFNQCNGQKGWHRLYKHPQVGVAIKVFDLANRDVLGFGIAAPVIFSMPITQQGRFRWFFEMGTGPGFVSKPFDPDNNYKNIAIGSHGNVFVMMGQRMSYRFSDHLTASFSASFNHFSNTAYTLPNLGVNYPTASVGIAYNFRELRLTDSNTTATDLQDDRWLVALAGGIKEVANPSDVKFPAFSLMAERKILAGQKNALTLGTDIMYNVGLYHFRNAEFGATTPLENTRIGARLGYQIHVDALVILLQIGVYAYDSYGGDGRIYNRSGLRYFFTKHSGVNATLKTHLFKADYFEVGWVYRF